MQALKFTASWRRHNDKVHQGRASLTLSSSVRVSFVCARGWRPCLGRLLGASVPGACGNMSSPRAVPVPHTRGTSRVLQRFSHLDELFKKKDPVAATGDERVRWHTESVVAESGICTKPELVLAKVLDDPLISSSSTAVPQTLSKPTSFPRARLWAKLGRGGQQSSPHVHTPPSESPRRWQWPKSPVAWNRVSVASMVRSSPLGRLRRRGGASPNTPTPAVGAGDDKKTRWAAAVATVKRQGPREADAATDSSPSSASSSPAVDALDDFMQSSSMCPPGGRPARAHFYEPWDPANDALNAFLASAGSNGEQ